MGAIDAWVQLDQNTMLSNLVARSLDPWSESARSWESLVINNLAKAFLG